MPNPIRSAARAVLESGVELVAACNRARLPKTPNPFVIGIHEPMREELTQQSLAVIGAIPTQLDGRYLKMGANPARPVSAGHNWFLGDGMVHGLAIKDGKALWVPQPVDRLTHGRGRPRSAGRSRTAARPQRHRQYQRRRYRGPRVRHRRGRQLPRRTIRDPGGATLQSVRRDAHQIVHRASAPRPDHRRDARDRL